MSSRNNTVINKKKKISTLPCTFISCPLWSSTLCCEFSDNPALTDLFARTRTKFQQKIFAWLITNFSRTYYFLFFFFVVVFFYFYSMILCVALCDIVQHHSHFRLILAATFLFRYFFQVGCNSPQKRRLFQRTLRSRRRPNCRDTTPSSPSVFYTKGCIVCAQKLVKGLDIQG